jgi:hypothetical protein
MPIGRTHPGGSHASFQASSLVRRLLWVAVKRFQAPHPNGGEVVNAVYERPEVFHSPSLVEVSMNETLHQCIEECVDCHSICLNTTTYCLEQGGRHAEGGHMRLLIDCAEICQTSANFMLRGSPLHARTSAVCAEICARCAEDCGHFKDDAHMERCAETCRRCAESCRQMAAHG